MKKRFLGWILALALLVGVLPQLFLGAAAAQTLPAAPNASLRYEECADVSVGTIRYVAQLGISPYFYNSYWGPFADSAGHECFTSSISMALSYIGVNATPVALGNYWLSRGYTGNPFATTPRDLEAFGVVFAECPLDEAMANYRNGGGKYSPPILHLNSYSASGHYVVLAGQSSDGTYLVVDPAVETVWPLTVSGRVVSYEKDGSARSETIGNVAQFYNPNAAARALHRDGSICPAGAFIDIPDETAWSHAGIDYCAENGLMLGVDSTHFNPSAHMTRAMLVTVLYRVAGSPDVSKEKTPFRDIRADWYRDAVTWAYQLGVTSGVSGTTFAPDATITREQLVTMLFRYHLIFGGTVGTLPPLTGYTDAARVSDWAETAIRWAVSEGIINGVSSTTLQPGGSAKRDQIATILMRYQTGQ